MRHPLVSLAALGALLSPLLNAGTGAQGQPLSASDVTSVRSIVGGVAPQWSPDGARLLIGGALGGSDLWTVPAAGGLPTSLDIQLGEIAFLQSHQPKYAPNGQWLSYISNRNGPAELFVRSLQDGTEMQLTNLGGRINSYSWSPDGNSIAFAGDKFGHFDVYTVTVPGKAVVRLTNDTRYEVFPTWTPDGKRVVYARMDERWLEHEVLERSAAGDGQPRTIVKDVDFFDYQAGGNFGYSLVSPDGSTLLFRSHRSGWINYWIVPMAGGVPRPVAAEAANQSGARWSPDGKSILYQALWNGTQDLRIVAAGGGAPRVLAKPDGMGVISNAEWSPDGRQVSFTRETPTEAADLFVVNTAGGAPRRLTTSSTASHVASRLITPKKVSYKSPDGLTIQAYLYEPTLAPGSKAPGILFIHGGPTSSFNDTYQAQVQYLAMRGYAVLLPNIRGSSGYGKIFEDANNGCWGRCDLPDVTSGVEFLKTLPYIEPTRMGITGTSYGGCMSLAAAAFAPGVFQAAIAASGYGDWLHFHAEQELRHVKLVEYEFGDLPQAADKYRMSSPIFFMKEIQTPIMLIHGVGAQLPRSVASATFADRLEMNYKPFTYKTYPNENYYIRRRDNIQVMLGDMVAYFDQHLKDGIREPARAREGTR
ncbi:MAG: S9 family peptidase [Gemmatimonas sp.]